MFVPSKVQGRNADPGNVLAPFIEDYQKHFETGRYEAKIIRSYVSTVFHFGEWLQTQGFGIDDIDEALLRRFLFDSAPDSKGFYRAQLNLPSKKPALNHLMRILRERGVISRPAPDAIAREITLFDSKMIEVRGLSKSTRRQYCLRIAKLLKSQFGSGLIDFTAISPSNIRNFVLGSIGSSPSAMRARAGAVRCYLRHHELLGNSAAALLRAVPRPAFWRETSLPKTLSTEELKQLLGAFKSCGSRRRGYAIVRCLVDLGLRSNEVGKLCLDDIDWQAGTVTISAGKARRADLLPLPASTGEAIADYLRNERPRTKRREIFVRHIAPVGEPVGPGAVQRTVCGAYRRLGWERIGVHVLRHTLGSRLVNAGTPMKQIADVLRHRSIVTSATYARVDVSRLSAVALPWPGSAS